MLLKKQKKKADFILVIVHGGHEHYQLPSIRMQETYRFFIDAGADCVINGHQHCYSGYELYKGKPIFYGLGNFCFDRPGKENDIWNEGYMVMLEIKCEKISFKLIPYQQCNDKMGVYLIKDLNLFEDNIQRLNSIIANKQKFKVELDKYYCQTSPSYLNQYLSYHNRLLDILCRIGVFPAKTNTKKIPQILNSIQCESHREKLTFALSQKRN